MKKPMLSRLLFVCLVIALAVALANVRLTFLSVHDRLLAQHGGENQEQRILFSATDRSYSSHDDDNKSLYPGIGALPGPFYDGRLFLLGLRLTSTLQEEDSLFVDMFAFPGDWFHEGLRRQEPRCQHPKLKDTLMTYGNVTEGYEFYCQVECPKGIANSRCRGGDDDGGNAERITKLIPMEHVPIISADSNQRKSTLIYRCDVGRHAAIAKRDLNSKLGQVRGDSLRVHLWIAPKRQQRRHQSRRNHAELVTTTDIPLKTGVAGHAGPQIVGSDSEDYLSRPPITTGLCVAIYGLAVQTHLPEFVQHHRNLGFEQIVIGVNSTSEEVASARRLLAPFIEEGVVVLAKIGVNPEGLSCASRQNLQNLPFYHSCLYHYKGFAKYVAMWDLDEYWVPPKSLPQPDHDHQHWQGKYTETEEDAAVVAHAERGASLSGPTTAIPALVTEDPLWRASNYSKSFSVGDVMTAVEDYYHRIGCGDSWCYHQFVSYEVQLHDGVINHRQKRKNLIAADFHTRSIVAGSTWQKSIANTRVAHMGGIHCPGSCRRYRNQTSNISDPPSSSASDHYSAQGDNPCRPRKFRPNVYGSVHHFPNMLKLRYIRPFNSSWPIDEYIERFGNTVTAQLGRLPDEQKKQWDVVKLAKDKMNCRWHGTC